jgi:hypothetical protein
LGKQLPKITDQRAVRLAGRAASSGRNRPVMLAALMAA